MKQHYNNLMNAAIEEHKMELKGEMEKIKENLYAITESIRAETKDALYHQLNFIQESYVDGKINQQETQKNMMVSQSKVDDLQSFVTNFLMQNPNPISTNQRVDSSPDRSEGPTIGQKFKADWLTDAQTLQNMFNSHIVE